MFFGPTTDLLSCEEEVEKKKDSGLGQLDRSALLESPSDADVAVWRASPPVDKWPLKTAAGIIPLSQKHDGDEVVRDGFEAA